MANEHLATYLNDHLAFLGGSRELLEHLEAAHAGTHLETFFAELRADIAEDRRELRGVMRRLLVTESRTRKASAWLAEKVTELKLRLDDPKAGALHCLNLLRRCRLGIEGKRLLWVALAAAADDSRELQVPNVVRQTDHNL